MNKKSKFNKEIMRKKKKLPIIGRTIMSKTNNNFLIDDFESFYI
jgi:hypothetical protein